MEPRIPTLEEPGREAVEAAGPAARPAPPYYDLTTVVEDGFVWWPGLAVEVRPLVWQERRCVLEEGCHFTVRLFERLSMHTGTHVDAPSHTAAGGGTVEALAAERFVGRCQVIRVEVGRDQPILPAHLTAEVAAPRVLLRTDTFFLDGRFNEDPAYPTRELVDHLHERGVDLLGIDGPSIDRLDSKDFPAHRALAAHGMVGLEWLLLAGVPAGVYVLEALPLRLRGLDASMTRALLWQPSAWRARVDS